MRRLCVDEARPGKNGGASAPDSRQHPRQPRTPVGHATFLAMITILLASVYTPIAGPVHQPAFALGRPGAGIEGGAATMRRLLIPSAWCEQAQSPRQQPPRSSTATPDLRSLASVALALKPCSSAHPAHTPDTKSLHFAAPRGYVLQTSRNALGALPQAGFRRGPGRLQRAGQGVSSAWGGSSGPRQGSREDPRPPFLVACAHQSPV